MGVGVRQSPADHIPSRGFTGETRWDTTNEKWVIWDGAAWADAPSGGGVTDHGALTGLGDDDHTQYALADGSRGDFDALGAAATAESNAEAYADTQDAAHVSASDPHAQYQKESEKGISNGYASLNSSVKVVEDPANATSTPTASKIPIADSNGRLNSWVYYVPTGSIILWAGLSGSVPSGWLLCDGSEFDPTTYPTLAGLITTTYNTGGETPGYIRVPNLSTRFPLGISSNSDRGSLGGASTHTHTVTSAATGITASITSNAPNKAPGAQPAAMAQAVTVTDPGHNHTTVAASSFPPYIGLWYIIRT